MLSRRGFIRAGAGLCGSLALRPLGALPAFAQSAADYRALVCIFLYGGNDSNNMVIPAGPADLQAYTSMRGSLALTGDALTAPVASVSGAPYAFHSMLAEMASLFQTKELAVVANVGPLVQPLTRDQYQHQQAPIPLNLFSHSDQQMEWQTGVPQTNTSTGWAGRAADYVAAQKLNASSFPPFLSVAGNSLLGTGAQTQPVAIAPGKSLEITGFGNNNAEFSARRNAFEQLLVSGAGLALAQAANAVVSNSIADAQALEGALGRAAALKTAFPHTAIAAQLEQVAQIIQVQADLGMSRQIFFCSLGGFDTHTNELDTHNRLYPQLSQAMAAFYDATQELGLAENVTVFTESDFSRTFQPTSGNGTDHAWGSHHLVLGGAVRGGRIYGKFPAFQFGGPDDADVRGRWIPSTSIDQYGATLCSWFGIPDGAMSAVFPNLANFSTRNLGFLG